MRFPSIAIALFFLLPNLAWAQVIITEIMYDIEGTDTGREWIEIKNTGTEAIDITTWKLFEANTNHSISSSGALLLPAGGFAVIADVPDKFRADNPNFSGLVFDSAFSLNNTGETIALKDQSGAEIDSITYASATGAAGNGLTLQRADGAWIAAIPTVGSDTTATESENPPPEDTSGNDTGGSDQENNNQSQSQNQVVIIHSSHSSQEVANGSYDEPQLVVTSGRPRLGYVGVPLPFEAKVKSTKNIPLGNTVGSTWSLGDGVQKSGQFISHTYEFPGEYTVILNSSTGGASAVSKVKVKIVEPKVSIKTANASYIELENADSTELNIGNWIIETKNKRFILPQDTIVSPRSTLKLSSKTTHITDPSEFVRIGNPSGVVLASVLVSGSVTSLSGDVAIALPDGMSESVFRERVAIASHGALARQAIPTPAVLAQVSATSTRLTAQKSISTSSLPAAVIYTVQDTPEKGWWGKLISIFD